MQMKIRIEHDNNMKSIIPFKIINYPAGEVGVVWEGIEDYISDWGVVIDIDVCLYNANDFLVLHRIISDIKKSKKVYKDLVNLKSINIKYMGFLRQDTEREIFDSRDRDTAILWETVMADTAWDILNNATMDMNCAITVLDPHSSVPNFVEIQQPNILFPNVEPIFPDEGALKRYARTVYSHQDSKPFLYAEKRRGDGGNIISYELVDILGHFDPNKDYVVFDDICDGGATFIHLAKLLRGKGHMGKLYLQVTHGLFTKGKDILLDYYDDIRTMTEMV